MPGRRSSRALRIWFIVPWGRNTPTQFRLQRMSEHFASGRSPPSYSLQRPVFNAESRPGVPRAQAAHGRDAGRLRADKIGLSSVEREFKSDCNQSFKGYRCFPCESGSRLPFRNCCSACRAFGRRAAACCSSPTTLKWARAPWRRRRFCACWGRSRTGWAMRSPRAGRRTGATARIPTGSSGTRSFS